MRKKQKYPDGLTSRKIMSSAAMLARWYPLLDTRSPEKWVDHLGKTARGGADEAASWTPSHGAAHRQQVARVAPSRSTRAALVELSRTLQGCRGRASAREHVVRRPGAGSEARSKEQAARPEEPDAGTRREWP